MDEEAQDYDELDEQEENQAEDKYYGGFNIDEYNEPSSRFKGRRSSRNK